MNNEDFFTDWDFDQVEHIEQAEVAIRCLAKLEKRVEKTKALYKQEQERLKARLADLTESDIARIENIRESLLILHQNEQVRHRAYPSGTVTVAHQKQRLAVIDERAATELLETHIPDAVRVRKSVDKAELNRRIQGKSIVSSDGELIEIDESTGLGFTEARDTIRIEKPRAGEA